MQFHLALEVLSIQFRGILTAGVERKTQEAKLALERRIEITVPTSLPHTLVVE